MNLKNISDNELIKNTVGLVREEREILTSILHHLGEVQRRRLYSSLKYKSLYEFTVKHLGYPEDQAYRRIAAMKLLVELPEVEEKINSGEISLTHIGLANSLFKKEKKHGQKEFTRIQKIKVFEQIAGQSVRDAEKITLSLATFPERLIPDRIRPLTENHIEIKLTTSREVQDKIERLKGMLAHKFPDLTIGELFEKLCDLGIETWNPFTKSAAPRKRCGKISQAQVRREIFRKAQYMCENCGSTYALEIDHIRPQALGGDSSPENLRVLCRSCNQRAAIKVYGLNKMETHL